MTAYSLIAPLVMIVISVLIGVAFNFFPAKKQAHKPIPLVVFAMVVGVLSFILTALFSSTIYSFGLFQDFTSVFQEIETPLIKYNAQMVAVIILVTLLEVGLASGFGAAFTLDNRRQKRRVDTSSTEKASVAVNGVNGAAKKVNTQTIPTATLTNHAFTSQHIAQDQSLHRDEQTLMELFLYGKVNQVVPIVNSGKPEGYFYEGIPQLDWDTKHSRQVLDALVRKGYLNAELVDKVIVCQTCGSGNLRLVKSCPECDSLRLQKESLIEHSSCGAVERQSAFETKNGDVVCPKCKEKLGLIGSDYRVLPPAYKCLDCNTLNSEPQLTIKCGDCTAAAVIDDEPEIYLYKYTTNSQMPLHGLQHIKPLETVTQFFRALGKNIVAPAFISGKSGTQHLFDILVLGSVEWVETQKTKSKVAPRSYNGNTVVEVLIASKTVDVDEVTRIYGKISDIDCDFILFAIPGLTPSARNYAQAYGVKVSEGKNIEEALANSKIPKVSGAEV